jgi:SAM-dependent methyltransferase
MAAPRHRVGVILRMLGEIGPESVIDIGCGNGQLLSEIAEAHPGARLSGLDLSAMQIDDNRRRLPGIEWIAADIQLDLESLRKVHDVAVASEIIEHLDAPARLLENASRLVRDGGKLIVTTQSGRIGQTERSVGHVRHFSASEIETLMTENGWRPIKVWNEGFPFHDLSKWWANRNPSGSIDRFGSRPYGASERLVCFLLRLAFKFNSSRSGAQVFALAEKAQ